MPYKTTKLFFCFFLTCVFLFPALGQSIYHQTITTMGTATNSVELNGLFVQQSIGQSSVTGVYSSSSLRISQGFLRGREVLFQEITPALEVIAFPNAFDDLIWFRYTKDYMEETHVQVIDIQGKLVYEAFRQPTNKEIEINLSFLAPGGYLVHLRSKNKFFQKRIIKRP